ncbi:MAG: hypothetical protein ACE5I5_19895, partial [Candidatus Heimdallarchaeota archaeon]
SGCEIRTDRSTYAMNHEYEYDEVTELQERYYNQLEGDFDRIMRTFETGATRDSDEGKLDWEGFISPIAMRQFARYMDKHRKQADGTMRDSDNWQAGMPRKQYMKSLIRHTWDLWELWRRDHLKDDLIDLLCAVLFNVQGLLHELSLGRSVGE